MIETAKHTTWRMWLIFFAALVLCVRMGTTQALAADVNTTGNNLTVVASDGGMTGGTNDVTFSWDGTKKTSVAVSGQISNATLSSATPFFGFTWAANDVAIYGPGAYTVYTGCPSGSPGCGTDTPITFTVSEEELGVHMIFKWGAPNASTSCGAANCDIDVVNVWTPGKAFGPSPMWTGSGGCNPTSKVWDWMSKEWDGDGKNGAAMLDGPFAGCSANFNVMATPIIPPTAPVLIYPEDGATGIETTIEFRWKKVGETDSIKYSLYYCTVQNFTGCTPVTIPAPTASRSNKGIFYAGGAGLLIICMTFLGGFSKKRMTVILLIVVFFSTSGMCCPCPGSADELSYTISGLSSNTTYYWKVVADDEDICYWRSSEVWSFTTQ